MNENHGRGQHRNHKGHDQHGHRQHGHGQHGHGQHGHDQHGHDHTAGLLRSGARHLRPLTIAFGLTAGFLVVQVVAGLWFNSLALLSDAGHMFTDVLGLGLALTAIRLANAAAQSRKPTHHTFGLYRLEILAAFVNALLLFAVAIYIGIEAIRRLAGDPEVPDPMMLVVAVLGLVVNVIALLLLRRGAGESLNVEGAYLEVLADLIGSVGVIIGGIVIVATGWSWVDPLIAVAIGVWILPRTFNLGRRAARVLLQSAPIDMDLDGMARQLGEIPAVIDVHDLHVWTLTSGMEAMSAHLMTTEHADAHQVLDQARDLLDRDYGITHTTLQVEPAGHRGCAAVDW